MTKNVSSRPSDSAWRGLFRIIKTQIIMAETQVEQFNIAPQPKKIDAKKAWQIVWEVVKWVLLGFLVLIILTNLIKIAKSKNGDRCPLVLGFGDAVVVSPSMTPTIGVGDIVFIHKQSSYKVGDIVTFFDPRIDNSDPITHRIISVSDGMYLTQGDANNTHDGQMISADDICGRVYMWIPRLGYFIAFMQSIWGVLIIFAIGFAIIEVPYLVKAVRKKTKNKREIAELKKRIAELDNTNKERKDLMRALKEKEQGPPKEKIYYIQAPKKKKGPIDD